MGNAELSQNKVANQPRGSLFWVIPDGYIPPESRGGLLSHEYMRAELWEPCGKSEYRHLF